MDHISENDSGIDSLRQYTSPFNHTRNVSHTETINEIDNSNTNQQRFKQVKFFFIFFFYQLKFLNKK